MKTNHKSRHIWGYKNTKHHTTLLNIKNTIKAFCQTEVHQLLLIWKKMETNDNNAERKQESGEQFKHIKRGKYSQNIP